MAFFGQFVQEAAFLMEAQLFRRRHIRLPGLNFQKTHRMDRVEERLAAAP
jgi:hypothetical protein